MKLLMTADTIGGVWTYALETVTALKLRGAEVRLATMGRRPDRGQVAAAARAGVAELHVSQYLLEWEPDPWEEVDAAGRWLLDLAHESDPDVVHLNGYAHGALPWPCPVVVVAHSDVLSWWRAVRGTPVPDELSRYHEVVEAGLQGASAICAPTRAVFEDLRASYSFDAPSFVVPNGRTAPGASAVAKEPLVVGLGRFWDEAKNVAALHRVGPRVPWPIRLAGPGTASGRLSAGDTASLLARAAIFASPARYEPFGLAALEAAQAGCALVLGDLRSLREVWGDAAAFVPPDDEDALAETLAELCTNISMRTALAARARQRAAAYTPAATARALEAVYRSVLAPAAEGAVA